MHYVVECTVGGECIIGEMVDAIGCYSDAPSHACVAFAGGQSLGQPPASFQLEADGIPPLD